tara:strand:+ start:164 stop:523 length:360 start_codon:yes stop_codon:yes gene_type:complete
MFQYNNENLTIQYGKYENGLIAIQLFDEDQLPYMTASLNPFNDKQSKIIASWNKIFPSADYVAIKNYSENAGIEQALIENGILKDNNKMMTIPLEANEKISVNIYWIDLINPINSQELN